MCEYEELVKLVDCAYSFRNQGGDKNSEYTGSNRGQMNDTQSGELGHDESE